jgi:hypothetical protein
MTLAEDMQDRTWDDLTNEEKIDVMATYIIGLENEVEGLSFRLEQLDRDLDVIDGGAY